MAKATDISPADGTENNAAPHTEVTSMNVPMNSAINLRVIVPASLKSPARFDQRPEQNKRDDRTGLSTVPHT
jgi:hypothetical protein